MNRLLTVVLIFLSGALAALALLAYFAYVIEAGPPEEATVDGLADRVTVGFSDQRTSAVEALTLADAMSGLGYAQAAVQPWPLAVYRAAATGELSKLAGKRGVPADELAAQIGLEASAHSAYRSLGPEQREVLDAFARGVNAALSSRSVQRDPSLVLSGHVPSVWEPWHSIAVERLFAWVSAEPDTASAVHIERPIRELLRLHDFGESLIVASEAPAEPGIYVRYVWGSSALPVLFESAISLAGQPTLRGACLIGTPFFLSGRTASRSWAFLLDQSLAVSRVPLDSLRNLSRQIFLLPDGSEKLVDVAQSDTSALVGDPEDGSDGSVGSVVHWKGLRPVTDAEGWLELIRDRDPAFQLAAGSGILVSEAGRVSTFRSEAAALAAGQVATESAFFSYARRRLDSLMLAGPGFNPRAWFADTFSPWAAAWAPAVVRSVAEAGGADALTDEASTYLRNWDFRFDGASIAASIFATWAEEAFREFGSWPGLSRSDSVRTMQASARLFWGAVDSLAQRYGYDLSVWRWEDVGAAEVHFPLLRESNEGAPRGLSRFTPHTIRGNGHPSAPNWSAVAGADAAKPANSWEGWSRMTLPVDFMIRRWYPNVSSGIRRESYPDKDAMTYPVDGRHAVRTVLTPGRRTDAG